MSPEAILIKQTLVGYHMSSLVFINANHMSLLLAFIIGSPFSQLIWLVLVTGSYVAHCYGFSSVHLYCAVFGVNNIVFG